MFVRVVRDLEEHERAITALGGDRVVIEVARVSEADLQALADRIAGDRDDLAELGIEIAGVGVDAENGVAELVIVAAQAER